MALLMQSIETKPPELDVGFDVFTSEGYFGSLDWRVEKYMALGGIPATHDFRWDSHV